jgi:hypothetical protein
MTVPFNHVCVILVDVPSVNPCTKRQPKIFLPITYDEVNHGYALVSTKNEAHFVPKPKRPLMYLRIKTLPPVFHRVLKSSLSLENFHSFWVILNTNPNLLAWLKTYNQSSEPGHKPKQSVAHYLLSQCFSAEEIKRQLYLS